MARLILIFIIAGVASVNNSFAQDTIVVSSAIPFDLDCSSRAMQDHYIINNENGYSELKNICKDLPVIDFNNYTLLGYRIKGFGCRAFNFKARLLKVNEEYIFTINYDLFGFCKRPWFKAKFLLLPKIPSDAIIKFQEIPNRVKS